jgi:uncharacterized lipoprotein YddW (UPF0748 family)
VASIESKGTRSYCVGVLRLHRFDSNNVWRSLALGVVLAACLPACSPDDFPGGRRPAQDSTAATIAPAETLETVELEKAPAPVRGLWILAEGSYRVLDDPTRIAPLLDRAARLGATELFVQVYRGGRVFYPGPDFAERWPRVDESGSDVLGALLEAAHARGMRIHAWVNVLSLSTRRDARLIEDLGPGAVLVDRRGRSILDYPNLDLPEPDRRFYRMGTRGLYLDPAVPRVRERLLATFRDLVTRYPSLDGLHLDYIRHPGVLPFSPGSRFGVGLEFGYGEQTRALYRAETGNADPIEGAASGHVRHAAQWDAWQRQQVTRLVEEIGEQTRLARPGLVVSAAVIPYVDRAYLSLAQDWRGWLESGAIDVAIPMVYTVDDRLLRYQLETFAGWSQADRIWPGLGVWLFAANPARAVAQLEVLRQNGFRGEVLFSDDALSESEGLTGALAVSASNQ